MTQPAPVYQPYQPRPPMMGYQAPPKQSGGGLTSMLAGILVLLTAGLAVGGSFLPITTYRNSFDSDGDPFVSAVKFTWWGYVDNGSTEPSDPDSSLLGLSLVLVAALLVLGAVFAFVASRSRAAGPTTGGRSLISAGVGVLLGVMLLEVLAVVEQASRFNDRDLEAGESLEYTPGLGLILPLAALGLGLVAVVLAHVGQRPQVVRVEPNTPRMGFQAPYGYQKAPGAPVPAPGTASAPAAEEIDDAADTQRVPGETASGGTPAEPVSGGTPAEPVSSVAAPAPATSGHVAPKADPAPAAPVTPASPAGDSGHDSEWAATDPTPETPAEPATPPSAAPAASPAVDLSKAPAEPATPPAAPASPATPVSDAAASPAASPANPPEAPAEPAAPVSASPVTPPAPASPASEAPAAPTPLTDLPAAPPAPELAEKKDDGK